MTLLRLLLIFSLVPLAEIALLIEVGRRIGLPATLALVLLTAAAGAVLARRQGLAVVRSIGDDLSRGELPAVGLMDGALILIGGILLVTPGFLTDAAGLLLLVPAVRRWIRRWLRRALEGAIARGTVTFVGRW
ncbi:MAG TPA: FxsA family protein [Bacillota bacterium]|nr:FxsA family protein [Bacillota bacterium]